MKIKLLLCSYMLLMVATANAQDYIRYQRYFNQVDIHVKKQELHLAIKILDTVDREYPFVFAKHAMMGLQICCTASDSLRAAQWLTRCFLAGIPGWIIRQNAITTPARYYSTTKQVWAAYDSLRNRYRQSIDTALAARISTLMDKDMRYTSKVNNGAAVMAPVNGLLWIRNNTRVYKELKPIIETYGFPGERLIGLTPALEDSIVYEKIIRDGGLANVLKQGQAFFILLHYFSTPRNHINPLLFKSVGNGLLPVEYYARISDYQYIAGKHRKRHPPFYVHSSNVKEDITVVNARRESIGLFTFEHQQENKALYWARKRTNTLNTEIIYE